MNWFIASAQKLTWLHVRNTTIYTTSTQSNISVSHSLTYLQRCATESRPTATCCVLFFKCFLKRYLKTQRIHSAEIRYLKDDGRQCGLVVSVLVSFRFCFFLPVLLVSFQGLPQPACYIRLNTRKSQAESPAPHWAKALLLCHSNLVNF